MDLVCLPLDQLNVILGMNYLDFNCVRINCYNRSVLFLKVDEGEDLFVSAKQIDEVVNDGE